MSAAGLLQRGILFSGYFTGEANTASASPLAKSVVNSRKRIRILFVSSTPNVDIFLWAACLLQLIIMYLAVFADGRTVALFPLSLFEKRYFSEEANAS